MPLQIFSSRLNKTYYLHSRLANGGQKLYYINADPAPPVEDAIPGGYEIVEDKATGFPTLQHARGDDSTET